MYGIVHDPGGTAPRLEFNTPVLVLCSGISKRCCEVVNVTHLVVAERILAKTGPWIARGKRTPMPPSLTIAAGGRTRVLGGFPQGKDCPSSSWGDFLARVFFYLRKIHNNNNKTMARCYVLSRRHRSRLEFNTLWFRVWLPPPPVV